MRESLDYYRALRKHQVGGIGPLAWKNLSKLRQFTPERAGHDQLTTGSTNDGFCTMGVTTAAVTRATEQLSCDLNGEIAILNLKSKLYFGLTEVGAFIWQLIEQPLEPAAIARAVAAEFEVDPALCAADVEQFLKALDYAGLLAAG